MLILASAVTGCVSISEFASLVTIPLNIMYSAKGIKICTITVGIKKYKSMVNKTKNKHDKIVFLKKDKLNHIEVLMSKTLLEPYISHDESVSVNDLLRKYYEMKEDIKNPETSVEYTMQKQWTPILSVVKKYTANKNSSVGETKQNRLMLLSNCAIGGKKKSCSIKNQELPNDLFEMNKIINKFLLTGDKFMLELHLKQARFTYSACGPFTKHCERIKKFRET